MCTECSVVTVTQLVDLGTIPDHDMKHTLYPCRTGKDSSISKWFEYFIYDGSDVSASLKFSMVRSSAKGSRSNSP